MMRSKSLWMLLAVIAVSFMLPQYAEAAKRKDPLFPQMVKGSSQIIDATIQYLGKEEMKVKINKTIKGDVKGSIAIGSFYEKIWNPVNDLRDVFKENNRYIFFLKDSLVGNVPYSPTKRSVEVPVKGTRVMTSLLAPGYENFWHPIEYNLFVRYLKEVQKSLSGEPMDTAFIGELMEKLNKVAKDPSRGDEQLVYLAILKDIQPLKNVKLIKQLLKSNNVNVRYIALLQVKNLPRKVAIKLAIKMLDDPKLVIQSLAAKTLEELEAFEAIRALAKHIKKAKDKPVERIAADPVGTLETPKRAVLRALISFDSEKAMDIIEKELLSRDVVTFRLILDIFKEYEDETIQLLLLELMQDRNFYPLVVSIMDYFQAIKSPETVKYLMDLYNNQQAGPYVRKSIVEVLESYKDPSTVDFFIKALDDESNVVRQAAAKALGTLRSPKAVQVLHDYYFRESDRLTRGFFIDALSKIPTEEALNALKDLYKNESDKQMKKRIKQGIKESKFLAR